MSDKVKNSIFGGIAKKFNEMTSTEEYRKQFEADNPPVEEQPIINSDPAVQPSQQTVFATTTTTPIQPSSSNSTRIQAIKDKIHAYLEKINKPGIDFMEFWNAVAAMGGVNVANITAAFTALKIGSGNTLTKEYLQSTGDFYINAVTETIQKNIQDKTSDKQTLESSLMSEKSSLTTEVESLKTQIDQMSKNLKEKETALSKINDKFVPQMRSIDEEISDAGAAQSLIVSEIKSVLAGIEHVIK